MSREETTRSPLFVGAGPPLVRVKYAVLLVVGVLATIYHLWFAYTYGIAMNRHLLIHLGIMMVVVAVMSVDTNALSSDARLPKLETFVFLPIEIIAAIGVTTYLWLNYERLAIEQIGLYTDVDILVGAIIILLILDLSRRTFGGILSLVGVVGVVYAVYGRYFPGILQHQGVTLKRVIASSTIEFNGIYDIIVEVSATYIVVFIIFAGFLESYGALSYFIEIGGKAGTYIRSGVTQMAVFSSLSMGSVNGSAAANSATTGAFTIPLMKRNGINRDTAASVESVASSGGQIMPPIMGSAAFIMSEITGTSYLTIIGIALFPALLFYGTVVFAVHMLTLKEGASADFSTEPAMETINDDEGGGPSVDDVALGEAGRLSAAADDAQTSKSIVETFLDGLYLWIPITALMYMLVIARFGAVYAGFWAVVIALPAALLQELLQSDDYKAGLARYLGNTIDACRLGISNAASIAMAAAVMGLFVGVLSLTGFSATLAASLVDLAGGQLAILLVLAMITSILFGLGMPTVAAYIVAVILVAPALVNLGLEIETAHFFVFYFAILSAITPPVAIACIITTEIAKGNFWRVCGKSILLGGPLFVLPYVFVVNSELLYWRVPVTITTFLFMLLGMIALSAALIDYVGGPLGYPAQVGLGVAAFGIFFAPLLPSEMLSSAVRVGLSGLVAGVFAWRLGMTTQVRQRLEIWP